MRIVTIRSLLLAAAVAVPAASAAPPPHYVYRDVAFVTQTGRGTVTSAPRGIACPRVCRGIFVRGTRLVLTARPAAGWRLASFTSAWCTAEDGVCRFDLVSSHDCVGGACPVGAYGVRVEFARR